MSIGSATGGSLDSFIAQLISLERFPAVKLEKSKTVVAQKLAVLSDIDSKLTALKNALSGLKSSGSLSSLHAFTVSSSDDKVLTATANSDASAGTHVLRVSSLARSHALASGSFISSGTSFAAGTHGFNVTVDGTTTSVNVTVAEGDTNATVLARAASAVNLSGAAVSASVVTTDAATGAQKLVLTSKESGTRNIIASISDTTGSFATSLGIAGTSSTTAYSAATTLTAANAVFTLNGISLSSSSNNVSDALAGLTLDLKGIETGTDVTIKIAADTEKGKEKVEEFLAKYNELLTHVRSKLATSDKFETRGILAGSTSFVTLINDLRFGATRSVSGLASGSLASLGEIGISADREGKLTLSDAGKLEAALSTKLGQVEDLLGSADGVANRLATVVANFTGTNGSLEQEKNLLDSQTRRLNERIAQIDARLVQREKILRAQYGRMIEIVTRLTGQQVNLGGSGF